MALGTLAPDAGERVVARHELLTAVPEEEARPVIESIGKRPQRVSVIGQEVRNDHRFVGLADRFPAERTELPPREVRGERR